MITLHNLGLRPTCRPINNFCRVLQTTHSQAAVLPSLWSDNNIESYNTRTSLTQMSKKNRRNIIRTGMGQFVIKMHKTLPWKCVKNTNPKPEFPSIINPGFGFGKMNGFPRAPCFPKPGFQFLIGTQAFVISISNSNSNIFSKFEYSPVFEFRVSELQYQF